MTIRFLRFVSAVLLLALGLGCAARPAAFRKYGIRDGLFNEQARRVVEMPDGRILVQVDGMFCLFDGSRFHQLEYDRSKILPVESFLATNYYFDNSRHLWVKDNHHLFCIDTQTYRYVPPMDLLRASGIGAAVRNFFIDADGCAWIHTADDRLWFYDWTNAATLQFRIDEKDNGGMTATVSDIAQVGGRHYVFMSNGRIVAWDKARRRRVFAAPVITNGQEFRLRGMAWDSRTLVVRNEAGLAKFDIATRRCEQLVADSHIFDFHRVGDRLCASGWGRIHLFDRNLRLTRTLADIVDEQTGEPLDTDWQGVTIDRQGGLWACTFGNGVYYHSPRKVFAKFTPMTAAQMRREVLCAPYGVTLPLDGAVEDVRDVSRDSHGNLWVATVPNAIHRYDTATGRLQTVLDGLWGSVSFCRECPTPADGGGERPLLFCMRLNRLSLLSPGGGEYERLTERWPQLLQYRNMVTALTLPDGFLIGTQNGFFFFDTRAMRPDTMRFAALNANRFSDKCNCLYRDRRGVIYVGTQNGLLRYDERNRQLRRYGSADGLPNSCIQSVVEDRRHRLWIATVRGLVVMEGDSLFRRVADGSFAERMAGRRPDGTLVFGRTDGLLEINPDHTDLPRMALVPQLLLCNGELFAARSSLTGLRHDENYLSFTVSALNYAYPQHTVYRYRLDGLDTGWTTVNESDGNIQIAYTALPPGGYTLEVEAAMQGQPWGGALAVPVDIAPPWWQSWWACTLYVLLALALAAYILMSYLNAQRAKLEIERREARIRQLLDQIRLHSQIPAEVRSGLHEEIRITAADEQFLKKAVESIERNMSNSEYGVENLCSDMAMERTTLYRRLQKVVEQTPSAFIRTVRLKRAAELLRTGRYSVGEVADLTGFPNRRSFAKYFREAFGMLPSLYH